MEVVSRAALADRKFPELAHNSGFQEQSGNTLLLSRGMTAQLPVCWQE